MLILVAVTLVITLGENGIIAKAREASSNQQLEQERETLQNLALGAFDEKTMDVDFDVLDASLPTGWTGNNGTYTSPSGNVFTVLGNGTITVTNNGSDPEGEGLPEIAWGKKVPDGILMYGGDGAYASATSWNEYLNSIRTSMKEPADDKGFTEEEISELASSYLSDTLPSEINSEEWSFEIFDNNDYIIYCIEFSEEDGMFRRLYFRYRLASK